MYALRQSQLNLDFISRMSELDIMPPDWKFAQSHAKAVRPGIVESLFLKKGNHTFCKCCLKPIEKEQVPLCSNSKQLQFLGFGFPLYFVFLKYCIMLMLILICSYSAVSLYWGIQANAQFCQNRRLAPSGQGSLYCTSFMIFLSRIQGVLSGQQIILRISSFLIHMLALIYFRDNIKKTFEYYDQKSTALSDYSLILKNLPMKEGIQKNIKDFIQVHFEQDWQQFQKKFTSHHFIKQSQKVMQITLLPDITDYYKLVQQKQILLQQKRKVYIKQEKLINSNTIDFQLQNGIVIQLQNINGKIRQKMGQIQTVKQRYGKLASKDRLPAEMAIVILNTAMFKKTVLKYSKNNVLTKQTVGQYFGDFEGQISIQGAHEPSQIKWQNINYSQQRRFLGKIVSWILTFISIAIATVVFYFIMVSKTQNLLQAIQSSSTQGLQNQAQYNFAVFLVFFLLALIVLFNKFIMGWALHYFTHLEKHQHTSDEQFSFAIKYTIGLFFTTALMTLAVEAITYNNFFAHEYGVIEEQTIMFFMNSLLVPFIWLVNPWQLFNLFFRKLKKDKKYYTQKQANLIMSDTSYIIGKRYAQIIKTMWFTYLFVTMIPIGPFITCAGLGFYYWIDKYNLLRKSSLAHNVSGQMTFLSLKLLDFTLILRPIGEMIFDSQIRDGVNVSSIVFTCLAFVYLIIPLNPILQFFHQQKYNHQQKSYQQVKDYFLETYHTMHPILNFKAERIFNKMQRKINKNVSLTEIHQLELGNPDKSSTIILNQPQSSITQFRPRKNKEIIMKSSTSILDKQDNQQKQKQRETFNFIKQDEQSNEEIVSQERIVNQEMKIYHLN